MLGRIIICWLLCTATAFSDPGKPIRASITFDRSSAYLNEQILLTVKVSAHHAAFGMSSEEPVVDGATLVSLHKHEYQEQIDGVAYQSTERLYAVFAEQTGLLSVQPVSFQAQLPVSFSRDSNKSNPTIVATTDTVQLDISAPPSAGHVWLPAASLSLSRSWSNAQKQHTAVTRVGDPIEFLITATITAQHPAAIPELRIAPTAGLRIYPQPPDWRTEVTPAGLQGTLQQTITLVGTRADDITLPGLAVSWWDINQQQWQSSVLSPEKLVVQPGMRPTTAVRSWLLPVMSALAILPAMALTLLAHRYWRRRQRELPQRARQSADTSWRWVRRSVAQRNPQALRSALTVWNRHLHTGLAPGDIAALRAVNPALADIMVQLDHWLYAGGNPAGQSRKLDWHQIRAQLQSVRKSQRNQQRPDGTAGALYPG